MNADEQAIRDLIGLWHCATMAGDVTTVLGLMADDAIFLVTGAPPMRGRAVFESGLRTLLQSHRIESQGEIQEVSVNDDLAYCWTHLRISIITLADGKTTQRSGNALSILRRQKDGRWLLVRDANMLSLDAEAGQK